MSAKPKVAFYWCASCGGCEEAVLDLGEAFLDVAEKIDVVFWPVALDFKRADLEALPDHSIAAAFVNGGVRNAEQEEMVHLIREKAQLLFAFGACAQSGGVPGLANLWAREAILESIYGSEKPREVPEFQPRLRTLSDVVEVDYTIPGCPPTPKIIAAALTALLGGDLPETGSVLAPDRALCEECPRKESKPETLSVEAFKRPHQVAADEGECLLAQGLLCLGAATRAGCEARCIQGNMPCTGCFGPTSRVRDFGARALSAIASSAAGSVPEEIDRAFAGIPDPAGTFYRYSLAKVRFAGGAHEQH